jgi:hypothetical protein
MKRHSRFERLARGCFALTLSLTEWLELEEILASSRKARHVFRQRARQRTRWRSIPSPVANGLIAAPQY